MIYKINDEIKDIQKYISQCLDMKELDGLKDGDEIIAYSEKILKKYIFKRWEHCRWGKTDKQYISCCRACNGYMVVYDDITSLCTGSSKQPDKSLVLKIIKKVKLLEDKLFEI